MAAFRAVPATAKPFSSATAPPLPIPASPEALIRPMRRADASTRSDAPASPRHNAVMSAPSVTFNAPVRRARGQPGGNVGGYRRVFAFGKPTG